MNCFTSIYKIITFVFGGWLLFTSPLYAASKTFHGNGEYTMSDYESPMVAEQRALEYAKQSILEQAGVYVESYTKMENMRITQDNVDILVGKIIQIEEEHTEKKALSNGDLRIFASIKAQIDNESIKNLIKKRNKMMDVDALYSEIRKEIERDSKETEDIKNKIVELKKQNKSTVDLEKEFKIKEQEFCAEKKVEAAWEKIRKNKLQEAFELANEALKLNAKNLSAYNIRGIVCRNRGDYDDAIKEYSYIIAYDKGLHNVYSNRGNAYNSKGDYDKAINDFNKAIELKSDFAGYYYNRGVAYNEKKDYEHAMVDYTMAIKLDETYYEAYVNRGVIYGKRGDILNAIHDYDKALEIEPKDDIAYMNRGLLYCNTKKYKLAIDDFTKVIELDPLCSVAYHNRGKMYAEIGENEKAINDYSKAIGINPNDSDAYGDRGNIFCKEKKYKEAISDYNQAIKLTPGNGINYFNRGILFAKLKRYDEAIKDYMKVVNINPNAYAAFHEIGVAYYHKGDLKKAEKYFYKAYLMEPSQEYIKRNLQIVRGELRG